MAKSKDAFRTISEVSDWLETPTHVLRFWESKFSQIKPVKGAGGRRYYRPADIDLLAGIKQLLHEDGLTIKGTQKVLREHGVKHVASLGSKRISDADSGADIGAAGETDSGADQPEPDTSVAQDAGADQDTSQPPDLAPEPASELAPEQDRPAAPDTIAADTVPPEAPLQHALQFDDDMPAAQDEPHEAQEPDLPADDVSASGVTASDVSETDGPETDGLDADGTAPPEAEAAEAEAPEPEAAETAATDTSPAQQPPRQPVPGLPPAIAALLDMEDPTDMPGRLLGQIAIDGDIVARNAAEIAPLLDRLETIAKRMRAG